MAKKRTPVGPARVRALCDLPPKPKGDFVLYWMIATRRATDNFALQRALELATELDKPLVVFEPLRVGYRWASDRFHRFVLQGMRANLDAFEGTGAHYYPYVERDADEGKGLLEALAQKACAVVSDDYPCFFLPDMLGAATDLAERVGVRLEVVDSNGVFPMRSTERVFTRAFDFRRFLQRELKPHLDEAPRRKPFAGLSLKPLESLPAAIERRWPRASAEWLDGGAAELAPLPIDHGVAPVDCEGGAPAAQKALGRFLEERLERYADRRNHPDEAVTSELSPYLHFGHISAWRVVEGVLDAGGGALDAVGGKTDGSREGWWNADASAEALLDQVVTWRELGFNRCALDADFDRYETLPDWARKTLAEHADDERSHVYELEEFDAGATHDRLWNAAQNELRCSGRMHNYLRMLWGKKILEWSATPRDALATMIELNNKYALDGRDPNSYSGIFWTLGRYDRAWGPERPIFGKVRYMTSANTQRKVRVREYLDRWGSDEATLFA